MVYWKQFIGLSTYRNLKPPLWNTKCKLLGKWESYVLSVDNFLLGKLLRLSFNLDLPTGSKPEETEVAGNSGNAGAVFMVCRICNTRGVHRTVKCPDWYLAHHTDDTKANKGAYVPPSMRRGAERPGGSDMRRRSDENSVRVTNLSEDTREPDLLELFQTFGHVIRAYVATDQKTGMSRGFGFVNFVNREDAQRAINKLNGYGYDNLILRVEWATPRSN